MFAGKGAIFYQGTVLILAAAAFLAAMSCSRTPPGRDKQEEMVVTEKENGKTITLSQGGLLVVRLEFSAGTGYSWEVKEFDRGKLEFLGESTAESAKIPGGRETSLFRFKALQTGSSSLKLEYLRPWEKDTAPLEVFKIEVDIRAAK